MMTNRELDQLVEVMQHPGWKQVEALLFGDAQDLLGMSLVVRKDCSAAVQSALTKLGLDVPQDQEEQLRVYLAMRAVVAYLTEKKKQIELLKFTHEERARKGIEDGTLKPEPQTTLRGH